MRLLASPLGLLTLLIATGCGEKEEPATDDSTEVPEDTGPFDDSAANATDADADGFAAEDGDCDDANPDIHPGQSEDCDGVDNNCNGVTDEGFSDTDEDDTPDCLDAEDCDGLDNDGDGAVDESFSDADADGLADCLDTEDCDALDNDADGLIDEGFDADADGFTQCGSETAAPDCDDSDPAIYPGAAEVETDSVDNDCDALVDEGLWAFGDLTIVEIMVNPAAVADPEGEWVELMNTSDRELVLNGLRLTSGADAHVVESDALLRLEPGELLLIAGHGDPRQNGGVTADYAQGELSLSNESDELSVYAGAILIDSVSWDDGATMPDAEGASLSLDPSAFDALDNDDSAAWCAAVAPWGTRRDKGSPGEINPSCPSANR